MTRYLCIALVAATGCTEGGDFDFDFDESANNARFLLLDRSSPITCGQIADIPPQGLVPKISAEHSSDRVLLQLPATAFPAAYAPTDRIAIVKVDVDAKRLRETVAPLPTPERAWLLPPDGDIEDLDVASLKDDLANLRVLSAPACDDRLERACRGEVQCPSVELAYEQSISNRRGSTRKVVRYDDQALVYWSRIIHVVGTSTAPRLSVEVPIAVASDRQGGALLLDNKLCLKRVRGLDPPEQISCFEGTVSGTISADVAVGPDGKVWIAAQNRVLSYANGAWSERGSLRDPRIFFTQIQPLSENDYLLLNRTMDGGFLSLVRDSTAFVERDLQATDIVMGKDEVYILPYDTNDSRLYRMNIARTLETGTLAFTSEFLDFPSATTVTDSPHGPIVTSVIGTLHFLDYPGCEYPRLSRIPIASASIERGLVVLGVDISDFTNYLEADTRVFVLDIESPPLCTSN